MKVWITKYALAKGIIECEGVITTIHPNMVEVMCPGIWERYFHKPHWHTTRKDAVSRAEEMRVKKLASLQKQIARLDAMWFTEEKDYNVK
jgi:hypothetical protein